MTAKSAESVEALLARAAILFWDFDGVIKESLTVKAQAFEQLFLPYGRALADRVRQHHDAHGGVSRYQKIPLYLGWASEPATPALVQEYCERFSGLVFQAVIDAAWVPGVREYLGAHHTRQDFVLVTATPQDEIQQIVNASGIAACFREIHGAPTAKGAAVRDVLDRLHYSPGQALFVGDAETDLAAATENHVPFVLRCTDTNQELQARFEGSSFARLDVADNRGQ